MTHKRLILCASDENASPTLIYNSLVFKLYSVAVDATYNCIKVKECPQKRNISWVKIPVIGKFIDTYDEIVWVDPSITLTNDYSFDIFKALKPSKQGCVLGATKILNQVSSHVFYLDCSDKEKARKVLNEWWNSNITEYYDKVPYENSALVVNPYLKSVTELKDVSIDYKNAKNLLCISPEYGHIQIQEARRHYTQFFHGFKYPKKIGIFVNHCNFYMNGCNQMCVFLKQSLEAIGHFVDLIIVPTSTNPAQSMFVSNEIPYKFVAYNDIELSNYGLFIFGSYVPHKLIRSHMKELGIPTVVLHTSNSFDAHMNQSLLYNKTLTLPFYEQQFNKIADEIWLTENHGSMKQMLEVQNNMHVQIIPSIWSPLFTYQNHSLHSYIPRSKEHKIIDFVIVEPNASYSRSIWYPIVLAEAFYSKHPDHLGMVYLFGIDDETKMKLELFDIWKNKKIKVFPEYIQPNELFRFFSKPINTKNNHVMFITHTINNQLGYLHNSILNAKYPMFHNSKSAKGIGYYYDDSNVDVTVQAMYNAIENHDEVTYTNTIKPYIESLDVYAVDNVNKIKTVAHSMYVLKTAQPAQPAQPAQSAQSLQEVPRPRNEPQLIIHNDERNDQIQIVVITVCEERKKTMVQQFKDLDLINKFKIEFVEGITPKNTPIELKPVNDRFPEDAGTICCFLSHTIAMNWYLNNSNLPYLLLLEDDCSLVKQDFKSKLLALLDTFSSNEFDYISLGYNPKSLEKEHFKRPIVKHSDNVYWNLHKIYSFSSWGTQAQLFPKRTIASLVSLYNKPTTVEIWNNVVTHVESNTFFNSNLIRIQIDSLNSLLKHQAFVFPPLAIELKDNKSLISNHEDHNMIWQLGEEKDLYKLSDFYSWDKPAEVEYIVYTVSDERREQMKKQLSDLTLNAPHTFIDGITSTKAPFELISQDELYPEDKPTICCLLSFIRALEYFVLHSKSKYAIFFEDDAALVKSDFEVAVKKAIAVYEEKASEFDYISLGYNVGSITSELLNSELLQHHDNIYWNFHLINTRTDKGIINKNIWGAQAQLFSRKKAIELFNIIGGKTSCSDLYKGISSYIEKHGKVTRNRTRLQLDAILPVLMKQSILYPPIVIERANIKSLIIDNHTHAKTWVMGEAQGIYKLKDFYSY